MKTSNLNVNYGGVSYVGYAYASLPLAAALAAAMVQIDEEADSARAAALGDLSRAVEYQLAAQEARAFAAAGYAGGVPLSVQAWADAAELEPKAATDDIITEADAWQAALHAIRAARLQGKQRVLKAASHDAAETLTDEAISAIRASVQGVGNVA